MCSRPHLKIDICTKLLEICMIIHASLSEKQLSMAATLPLPFGCTLHLKLLSVVAC